MAKTDTMSPRELAVWIIHEDRCNYPIDQIELVVAARDATLVKQALRDAATRVDHDGWGAPSEDYRRRVRGLIMGTPPLVKGQLVRSRNIRGYLYEWGSNTILSTDKPDNFEPAKGHADAQGNLYVDEED